MILSASTNGKRILVAATATPGTTIHTATNTSGELDWVTLYAHNDHTSILTLTVEFGGTTSPDDVVRETLLSQAGDVLIIAGLPLRGGLVIKAFASVANKVTLSGFIERATTVS